MRKITAHLTIRLIIGIAAMTAFALAPQLAQAQAPGSLSELSDSPATGTGLSQTQGIAVSPAGTGNYVYTIASQDDAIAEFLRGSGGSLTQIGCIADRSATDSSCTNPAATGLVDPEAIAISPDGRTVYVAAEDAHGIGDIAVFTCGANGTLTPYSDTDPCIAENTGQTPDGEASDCDDQSVLTGSNFPIALAVAPNGDNVYVGDADGKAVRVR